MPVPPDDLRRAVAGSDSRPPTETPDPGGGETLAFLDDIPAEFAQRPEYIDIARIGGGGMGTVYVATNRYMGRREALKVINTQRMTDPAALDRFLQEIQAAAQLNHPNVAIAYAVHPLGKLLVFAMEYIDGDDLERVVRQEGPLSVTAACSYVGQAALGLQAAHEKGMVHRDIKPSNLILARGGKRPIVKILDFGLAKASIEGTDTGLTASGQIMGTPDYMAPEQARDAAKADIRADIYALGCTLYYLLSGRTPFGRGSLLELLEAHQRKEPPAITSHRPDLPFEVVSILERMMAKKPSARFQTPADVAKALAPHTRGKAIEPVTSTRSEPTPDLVYTRPGERSPTPTPAPKPVKAALAKEFDPSVDQPKPLSDREGVSSGGASLWGGGRSIALIGREANMGKRVSLNADPEEAAASDESETPTKGKRRRKRKKSAWNPMWFVGLAGLIFVGLVLAATLPKLLRRAQAEQPDLAAAADRAREVAKNDAEATGPEREPVKGGAAAPAGPLPWKNPDGTPMTEAPVTPPPPEFRKTPPPEFIALFNGQDSRGWLTNDSKKSRWNVVDGVLISQLGDNRSALSPPGLFGDLELDAEFRLSAGGKGLLAVRVGSGNQPRGIQLDEDNAHNGWAIRSGEWNRLQLRVVGNVEEYRINGVLTYRRTDAQPAVAPGQIHLISEPRTVLEFRRLDVRNLDRAPTGGYEGFTETPLTFADNAWRITTDQKQSWKLENGELVGTATSGEQAVVFDRLVGDYAMKFDFLLESGSHGVIVRGHPSDALEREGKPGQPPVVNIRGRLSDGGAALGSGRGLRSVEERSLPSPQPTESIGGWRTMELTVLGDRLKASVDGKPCLDVSLDRRAEPGPQTPGLARATGRFGFVTREGRVRIRRVGFKELPPTASPSPLELTGNVSPPAGATIVGPNQPVGFRNLTSAIPRAKPGAIVYLEPGIYMEPGTIELKKPLTILGGGPPGAVTVKTLKGNLFNVAAPGVKLENLSIGSDTSTTLFVQGGDLTVTNTLITGARHAAHVLGKGARLRLDRCIVRGDDPKETIGVLLGTDGVFDAEASEFLKCRVGLQVERSQNVLLGRCRFRDNMEGGVAVLSDGRAEMIECDLFDNGGYGLSTGDTATVGLRDCRIRGNKRAGFSVPNATAISRADRCDFRTATGLPINGPAERVKLEDCLK